MTDTLKKILEAVEGHGKDHPTHGIDCACMDRYIQRLRHLFIATDSHQQRRVDYVIYRALDNR